MRPGAGQGYRAILVKIITCLGPSCPTSRAPHHGQCLLAGPVDAEEAGVEIVLDRAVLSVAAAVGPAVTGIACRTPSRSGRRWQAVAWRRRRRWAARRWRGGVRDHAATSSAVLLRSWVVPQLQFIDREDGVRDGVLLVLPSVVHRDRYPQCFSWCRCLGFGTRLLYGGL